MINALQFTLLLLSLSLTLVLLMHWAQPKSVMQHKKELHQLLTGISIANLTLTTWHCFPSYFVVQDTFNLQIRMAAGCFQIHFFPPCRFKDARRSTLEIQFITVALGAFFVSVKCSASRVVMMSDPLVISDSCQSVLCCRESLQAKREELSWESH